MINSSFVKKHPSQYFTKEEKQADYSARDNYYIRCLQAMEEIMDIDAYILDYRNGNVIYITRNSSFRKICKGQIEENPLRYDFLKNMIQKEDWEKMETVSRVVYDFYFDLPVERRLHGASSLDIRMKDGNGKYLLVNHKRSILDMTEDGRIRLGLSVFSYPTGKTPGKYYFKMTDTHTVYEYIEKSGKFIEVQTQRLTSKSEKVLELASHGKTEAEIAALLNISLNTVKYHKQRIFSQLNVRNIAEAVQWMNSQKTLTDHL